MPIRSIRFCLGSTDPLSIFGGSSSVLVWLRSDLGVTQAGGVVSAWNDQSGNANHFTASSTEQPAWNSADSTISNLPSITGDGSDDRMICSGLNLVLPFTYLMIVKQNAWTTGRQWIGATGTNIASINEISSSPTVCQRNSTAGNSSSGAVLSNWVVCVAQFVGSTSDSLKIGTAATVTGTSAGTSDPGAGVGIFNRFAGAAASSIGLVELVILNRALLGSEEAAYASYVSTFTGGAAAYTAG